MANLSDLTYYANRSQGGIGAEEVNSDRGRAALAAAQQYDPGASWRQVFGSDGQSLGYTLDFDASKLPGASGSGSLGGTSGHGSGADYQIPFSTVQPHMNLTDPNAVTNSPDYGRITANTNIYDKFDPMSVLGPLAVLGFGFAAPSLFGGVTAGSGSALDGSLLPMMPTDPASLYDPMLPFNAADPSLAINGVTPAEAAAGGAATGAGSGLLDGALQPMMPQDPSSLYNPMLPFNPADPSLALQPGIWSRIGNAVQQLIKSPAGSSLLGGAHAGTGGGGGGLGGGLLGGGGAPGATQDALTLLKGFYGDPSLIGMANLARQRVGLLNG